MKQQIIFIIFNILIGHNLFSQINYHCNLEYVKQADINSTKLNNKLIKEFLLTFHKDCSNNVEYIEYSNETLFEILNSNPSLVLQVINDNIGKIEYKLILQAIENPIHDKIDLKKVKANVNSVEKDSKIKRDIISALNKALEKNKGT
jgi:hypothetical protein